MNISGYKPISRIVITFNFKCAKFHTIWHSAQAVICEKLLSNLSHGL